MDSIGGLCQGPLTLLTTKIREDLLALNKYIQKKSKLTEPDSKGSLIRPSSCPAGGFCLLPS